MTASMRRDTDQQRLLIAALSHAQRGWHVFPLRPNDKRPAISAWEQRATTDPDRIRRCWSRTPANVGLATGPSGLVVIDLDQPKPDIELPAEWQLPGVHWGLDVLAVIAERHDQPLPVETYRSLTPGQGEHLYFTAPPGIELHNTAGKLGPLIDSRAAGGYVVAAGSTINDRRYEADDTAQVARLPGWLTGLLVGSNAAPRPDVHQAVDVVARRSRYAAAALRGELDRVLDAPIGQRNHTLNAASFAIGQLIAADLIPDSLAVDALTHAAHAAGLSATEAAATIRSGLTAGTHHPRAEIGHPA